MAVSGLKRRRESMSPTEPAGSQPLSSKQALSRPNELAVLIGDGTLPVRPLLVYGATDAAALQSVLDAVGQAELLRRESKTSLSSIAVSVSSADRCDTLKSLFQSIIADLAANELSSLEHSTPPRSSSSSSSSGTGVRAAAAGAGLGHGAALHAAAALKEPNASLSLTPTRAEEVLRLRAVADAARRAGAEGAGLGTGGGAAARRANGRAPVTCLSGLARAMRELCPPDACTFVIVRHAERLPLLDATAVKALLLLPELTQRLVCPILLSGSPATVLGALEASDRRPSLVHLSGRAQDDRLTDDAADHDNEPPASSASSSSSSVADEPRTPSLNKKMRGALRRHVTALLASVCGPSASAETEYCVETLWPVFLHHVQRLSGLEAASANVLAAALRALHGDAMLLRRRLLHHDVQANASPGPTGTAERLDPPAEGAELPYVTKFVLVAAFLASHNPAETDSRFFAQVAGGRGRQGRRRAASASSSARRAKAAQALLLGPKPFPLHRLLAVTQALLVLSDGSAAAAAVTSAGVLGEVATLASLGLLERVGTTTDASTSRLRCVADRATVEDVARRANIELRSFLYDPAVHG